MGGMRGRASAAQNAEGITAAGLLIEDLLFKMQEFLKPTPLPSNLDRSQQSTGMGTQFPPRTT